MGVVAQLFLAILPALQKIWEQYGEKFSAYVMGRRREAAVRDIKQLKGQIEAQDEINEAVDKIRRQQSDGGTRVTDDWLQHGGSGRGKS